MRCGLERLRFLAGFLFVVTTFAAAAAQTAPPAGVPGRMRVCDKVGNAEACADWVWNGESFDYDYGPVAGKGMITRRGATDLVLTRADTRDPWFLKGERAEYAGSLDGIASAHGTVQYSVKGRSSFAGTWTATFAPIVVSGTDPATSGQDQPAPAARVRAQPLAVLEPTRMEEVCRTPQIRQAMQALDQQSMTDPAGAALYFGACAVMGACPDLGVERIKDSKIGSDGGRSAREDPGSFVCVGFFDRRGAKANVPDDGDVAATLTGNVMNAWLAANPTSIGWFKVAPITEHHFELTLTPSLQLSREYATVFDVP